MLKFAVLSLAVLASNLNKEQSVISFEGETHPILDQLVSNGVFNANDVSPEVSSSWDLLEKNFNADTIKLHLNEWLREESIGVPIHNNGQPLVDDKYNVVSIGGLDGYSLRVSDPEINIKTDKTNPMSLGVDSVKQATGYFDINDNDKHLFFWFFESRNDPANDPVILWLNGGPGCSSMTGLFFELGPSSINGTTLKPIKNPYSWNSNANVIFLEQPVGVGYSYAQKSKVSTTDQAAEDVFAFLQLFFTHFDQFAQNEFHIAGESYAGHYIPGIAHNIVEHKEDRVFNFKSVLIGNGITDPLIQYYQYIPMACNSTESGYKQLISDDECEDLERMYTRCAPLIKSCYKSQSVLTCLPANLYCEKMMGPFEKTGLNYYDIRIPCDGDGCYPQMEPIDKYLNQEYVMEALGSEVESYVGCDENVFRNFIFSGDEMKPFHQHIAELLEAGVPVLIYAGDKDYICNWLGNREWVNKLEWELSESFQQASINDWVTPSGEYAGTVQSNGLLTFLRVFNAGHMVPFDQSANSLDMVNRWIAGDYMYQ